MLQIDTQGFDYEVIKLFDIEKSRPAVIHFEHNMLTQAEWEECIQRLLDCGYQVSHTSEDTLACRKRRAAAGLGLSREALMNILAVT